MPKKLVDLPSENPSINGRWWRIYLLALLVSVVASVPVTLIAQFSENILWKQAASSVFMFDVGLAIAFPAAALGIRYIVRTGQLFRQIFPDFLRRRYE